MRAFVDERLERAWHLLSMPDYADGYAHHIQRLMVTGLYAPLHGV